MDYQRFKPLNQTFLNGLFIQFENSSNPMFLAKPGETYNVTMTTAGLGSKLVINFAASPGLSTNYVYNYLCKQLQ